MRLMRKYLTAAVALSLLAAGGRLTAQQPPEVKPGPEHELLKDWEGTWDASIKSPGNTSTSGSTR
jgi:hypothetical protein